MQFLVVVEFNHNINQTGKHEADIGTNPIPTSLSIAASTTESWTGLPLAGKCSYSGTR